VDVGAGDGGYVLYRARSEPTTFAIAIDASPDALSDGAWRAKRACLENAAFLVEGVERIGMQGELACLGDEVTVHFPWGSLLRGLVDGASSVVGPIARVMKAGAELRVLMSTLDRDGYTELTPALIASRCGRYCEHGLHLLEVGWASSAIVAESRSAWAKRLGVGRVRRAVIARYRRDAT
jgi:16S rRNA (adenine(1408)-N(1))-methyltransferase